MYLLSRFFFSQLDPADPSRQFSFVLQVDELDRYDVCDCEPSIDATILMDVTNHLNQTDDMGYLVRKMRKLDLGFILFANHRPLVD
jgi:hypothetical protein